MVPTSISWPERRIATRELSASTSLRMWEDRNTVWPRSTASCTEVRKACSMSGSNPEVGSSMTSRSARVMRAAMSTSFWRLPLE